jgi:hypothetical protein
LTVSGSTLGPGVTTPPPGVFVQDPAELVTTGAFVHWADARKGTRAMTAMLILNIMLITVLKL